MDNMGLQCIYIYIDIIYHLSISNVARQIVASERAFAAIRHDGSVVCWGPAEYGGDSRMVRHLLVDVMLGRHRGWVTTSHEGAMKKQGTIGNQAVAGEVHIIVLLYIISTIVQYHSSISV